ncbi:autotransporter assembly complex family protein [Rhizobium sp. RU20A]|uniref:autotransporter assembly complex protein TamA n=1 Tax=Rhizobium sp. RU20A TaxID=1907412 RepID=UPI001FCEAB27|nr:autotransporter assembly complex family protein [Rhizobium sp. RU20A]
MNLFGSEDETPDVIDPVRFALSLTVNGGDEDLKSAIENASRLYQGKDQPVSGDLGLAVTARDDRDRILAALYENARYGGTVEVTIAGTNLDNLPPDPVFADGVAVPVSIVVDAGPVFRLGTVRFEGDIANRNPATYGLPEGGEAGSAVILKAAERLLADLKEEGRPLAEITQRTVVADHATNTVDVTIVAKGGSIADVGDVSVKGTESVDAGFVADYSRLNAGKPYSPEDIRRAAERLRQLGVFSSVTIKEATQLAPNGTIPMTIQVSEGKMRYFGVGAQVSTTDGVGLQGYWGHRNLFGRAESLRIEGSVNRIGETKELDKLDYSTALLFSKPGAFGPASTFTASVKASLLDPDAYKATIFSGAAGATFELSDRDTASGGADLTYATITDAFGKRNYLTASVPLEYVRDTRTDKLNPTDGYRISVNARPSYEIEAGTIFSSFETSAAGYYSIDAENKFVLAGKIAAGTLVGGSGLADIPADRRFYLGGGGSVRGYAYQEISPRRADGAITGGRSYVSGSVEGRIAVTETIGVVPFADFGTVSAGSTPDFSELRVGAGVGLRYATPFGPIRLDVAVPLNPYPGGTSYGIYAGIGQSF